MNRGERIRRPEPERTRPIRNFSTLFGAPGRFSPPGCDGEPGRGSPNPSGPPAPGAPFSSPGGAASEGVASGYRVIEEYMRQGQEAARAMWGSFSPPGGPWPGGGMGGEDMMRFASQLATMWLDFVGMMVPGTFGGRVPPMGTAEPFSVGGEAGRDGEPGRGSPNPSGPGEGPPFSPAPEPPAPAGNGHDPSAEPTAFSIEIASARRTEVMIELRPRSSGLPLRVQDLRAPDPDLPRISGVSIEGIPSEDRVAVRITVPDDQPPGVYSGVVLDERTSLPRGTLSVRIAAA